MFILFFLIWIVFNGKITLEIALFGVAISTVLFIFSKKFLNYSLEKEWKIWKSFGLILDYVGTLVLEIIKANFQTMKHILSEKEQIVPVIVEFDSTLKTNTAKALLADSITLTPGTITVSVEENHYQVHCLDESMAEGIDASVFAKKLERLEKIWIQDGGRKSS